MEPISRRSKNENENEPDYDVVLPGTSRKIPESKPASYTDALRFARFRHLPDFNIAETRRDFR